MPTEALVADVIVSKYAWHLPLYRQSQMMATEGIEIDRSTLAHWVGFAAFELRPVYERLIALLKRSGKALRRRDALPGARSRPRQDQDRLPLGHRSRRSPVGWCRSAGSRLHVRARQRRRARDPAPCRVPGTLQVDGYVAYKQLTDPEARRRSARARQLLGALPARVLRHRQGRQRADRDRDASPHRRALSRSRTTSEDAAPTNAAASVRRRQSRSSTPSNSWLKDSNSRASPRARRSPRRSATASITGTGSAASSTTAESRWTPTPSSEASGRWL